MKNYSHTCANPNANPRRNATGRPNPSRPRGNGLAPSDRSPQSLRWATAIVVGIVISMPAMALAQASGAFDPTAKLQQVVTWVQNGAGIIAIIAIVFTGLKFMFGDPQASRQGLMVVIGASVLFGASSIIAWLES